MHQCDEFRERITEHIIDREDLSRTPEFQRELLICSSCSDFYAESREMIEAISSVEFPVTDDQLNSMTGRLRSSLQAESTVAAVFSEGGALSRLRFADRRQSSAWRAVFQWRELLAAAALLLVTIGLYQIATPEPPALASTDQFVYVDHSLPVDPVTVDFLEQSELLLRDAMRMQPADAEDVADVRRAAAEQLIAIRQRKDAVAEVPPLVSVMDTYETVLRDLRNLSAQDAAEDIDDIRSRIQNNALIANMKAFQPTVNVVNISLR